VTSTDNTSRPPSAWWLVVIAVIWTLAAVSLIAAIAHQRSVTAPIGEAEVFADNAETAAETIESQDSLDRAVRHARNRLGIEAVSLVSADGIVIASTSATLEDQPLTDEMLAAGVATGRFAAVAGAIDQPVEIDGVVEWPAGAVLYEVVSPLGDGSFVLLHYDVQELFGRRIQQGEIQPLTMQLIALGAVFGILGAAVLVGHSRAARRYGAMLAESELLKIRSREVEEANVELTRARSKAERALALAEEKMRIRSEFVLMINHELRTPLTSVVTGAELVRAGGLTVAEQSEVLDSMVTNGKRLGEIIDQILAVARIENRGLTYEVESLSIAEVCERIGITFVEEEPQRIEVETDVNSLKLVLNSLMDNAISHGATTVEASCHATPQIEGMLEVGMTPQSAVFFTVSDDGPGIDPEFLPRAFEKFEKNSSSSGTGLGLYMVRLMVEALLGSIAVDTGPEGTTIQIALPAVARERSMEAV
jgi:signal transduction histidine kinase